MIITLNSSLLGKFLYARIELYIERLSKPKLTHVEGFGRKNSKTRGVVHCENLLVVQDFSFIGL